jgi:hypothetical protein
VANLLAYPTVATSMQSLAQNYLVSALLYSQVKMSPNLVFHARSLLPAPLQFSVVM